MKASGNAIARCTDPKRAADLFRRLTKILNNERGLESLNILAKGTRK
jgi:hypothetical protein